MTHLRFAISDLRLKNECICDMRFPIFDLGNRGRKGPESQIKNRKSQIRNRKWVHPSGCTRFYQGRKIVRDEDSNVARQ